MMWVLIGFAVGLFFGYCESRDKWYLRGRKDGYKKAQQDAEWWYRKETEKW